MSPVATAIIVIFLVILAVVFFLWLVRTMLRVSCPTCLKESETEEIIVPVIPGYRWFCPRCQGVFPHKEIMQQIEPGKEGE